MTSPAIDLSICIATYNRAEQLAQCFEHFLTFSRINFELVIGDNASTDHTAEVVARYAGRFPHFNYHRHPTNIGMMGNFDAIHRLARGRYVYGHSDDDMAFESALIFMLRTLDENPSVSGINGTYFPCNKMYTGTDLPFDNPPLYLMRKGDYPALIKDIMMCDSCYMMRRETFQRHLSFHPRGVGLLAMAAHLLALGDVVWIKQPVLRHFNNRLSQSTRLAEASFQDGMVADIQVAFADAVAFLPPNTLNKLLIQHMKRLYPVTARMAREAGHYSDVWHFLRRLKGLGGADAALLVQCERAYLIPVIIEQLARLAQELDATLLALEDSPLMRGIQAQLQSRLPAAEWHYFQPGEFPAQADLCLLTEYADDYARHPALKATVALLDLLQNNRLTAHPIMIGMEGNLATISFTGYDGLALCRQDCPTFNEIATDWAASVEPE